MKEIFDSFLTTLYLHLKKKVQYFENQAKDITNVKNFNIQNLHPITGYDIISICTFSSFNGVFVRQKQRHQGYHPQ